MAKCIYVCRHHSVPASQEDDVSKLTTICNKLKPDHLSSVSYKIVTNGDSSFGIMNYQPSIQIKNESVLLGFLYQDADTWNQVGTEFPDGSYAIFRNSKSSFEAVSDIIASRTIWYYHDENYFITSTSQRAIIMYLGTFDFDERVIPWMLSSGTLGPEYSWDRRIKKLRPNSSLTLDKTTWKTSIRTIPFALSPRKQSKKEHKEHLKFAIEKSLKNLKSENLNQWPLTLSGGYDSRGILLFLKNSSDTSRHLKTMTYGLKDSLKDRYSDAYAANKLASELQTDHTFIPLNRSDETTEKIIDRFLACSEGRIDHIAAYMDGMAMWKVFADNEKVQGILRGDVIFFPYKVITDSFARHHLGCPLLSDFKNLEYINSYFGLSEQKLPSFLERKHDEPTEHWCDRLYHYFRYPVIHGALNDIKLSYTEVVIPLMSKRIVETVYTFPDRLRRDKSVFMEMIDSFQCKAPFASRSSTPNISNIFREPEFADMMVNKLSSTQSKELFGDDFATYLIQNIKVQKSAASDSNNKSKLHRLKQTLYQGLKAIYLHAGLNHFKARAYQSFPRPVLRLYEKLAKKPSLDPSLLAFRGYIIVRMTEILEHDTDFSELADSGQTVNKQATG
jgi:hypothetical protein